MLSKQDKLKYGEQLRMQMKMKQQKKRMDDMQKRGLRKSPTDTRIPVQPQYYADSKQSLQNRFETQNVDYYGRPGGGAPNKQVTEANNQNKQHQQPIFNSNSQAPMGRLKTNEQQPMYSQQQGYGHNYPYNSPPFESFQPAYNEPYQRNNAQGYLQHEQSTNLQQSYNNNPYAPPSYNPNFQPNHNFSNNGNNFVAQNASQRVPTDRSLQQYQQFEQSKPKQPSGYLQQRNYANPNYHNQNYGSQNYGNKNQQVQTYPQDYSNPIQEINEKHEANNQRAQQHQELMGIHKRGRNLLQLQNMTIHQQQAKQKQKDQIRRQLQQQMRQAQEKKKQEQERIKREQLQQERKAQQYLEMQKRRVQEEQQKKIQKIKQIEMQNAKNLQEKRRLDEEAKQKAMKERLKDQAPAQRANASIQNSPKNNKKQAFSRQSQFQLPNQETISQNSSSTELEKGFNTGVSKQFFENQRKKDQERYNREKNLQAVTDQIRRLKDQIDQQNNLFARQMQKIRLQSEMAENEKKKAEAEIQNLKNQLKRKMQDDNQRLFLALQRQSQLKQEEEYYAPPKKQNQRKANPKQMDYNNDYVESLKPRRDDKFVKKLYEAPMQQAKKPQYYERENRKLMESNISDQQQLAGSLYGDSKKIPLNIPDKLSMSKLQDFARKTQFFKNDGKNIYVNQKKNNLRHQQSIAEEDQERVQSRGGQRRPSNNSFKNQKDQLDRFVENKEKQRNWGQLSSVNSDITKQIQELLKKKDYQVNRRPPSGKKYQQNLYEPKYQAQYEARNNGRPSSNLSSAGKRTLSRGGMQYDGASLGTIKDSNAGNGTLDIDKIHNKNERRLNQLRNLGVQTINTNNDEQFSKLDMILNKYKQSRVL